ncbi:MAG: hypothetical protein PHG16_06805 [Lachnospiraceae bacterium]|nr:hypothetical protein [Lachnospiraceae bacterium]
MKSYESVWEIFNLCSNNQMRDVFIEEVELEDPESYIKQKFQDREFTYEKEVLADGTLVFEIITTGIRQRYTFTEI